MPHYRVLKPFRADNRNYVPGDVVDPYQWRVGQALINQRYLALVLDESEAPRRRKEAKCAS